jgi:excisionase family DNA binding protein
MLREVASEARLARPAHRGVVVVPRVAASGSEGTQSVLTVRDAAERLKVSERAVVKAIHSGRLSGRRVGSGARWEITTESVDRYVPRLSIQAREAKTMTQAELEEFVAEILDQMNRLDVLEAAVMDLVEVS